MDRKNSKINKPSASEEPEPEEYVSLEKELAKIWSFYHNEKEDRH